MENLLFLLDNADVTLQQACSTLGPAIRIVGYVYKGIQIIVPIILIIMGCLDFAKAVGEKSEDKIKAAQKLLAARAIAAVCVFLVASVVGALMNIVGSTEWKACAKCITRPGDEQCKKSLDAWAD